MSIFSHQTFSFRTFKTYKKPVLRAIAGFFGALGRLSLRCLPDASSSLLETDCRSEWIPARKRIVGGEVNINCLSQLEEGSRCVATPPHASSHPLWQAGSKKEEALQGKLTDDCMAGTKKHLIPLLPIPLLSSTRRPPLPDVSPRPVHYTHRTKTYCPCVHSQNKDLLMVLFNVFKRSI